ncbi:MAG TPA: hypothetical protein VEO54_10865 [Thermoanaerobaculia bacterium]|nr:hypothetical protein [Thermoanaerobaculia bacterium]
MKNAQELPFLLRYEEEADGDAVMDGLDDDYYYEPDNGGMAIRRRFIPWESWATLKILEP